MRVGDITTYAFARSLPGVVCSYQTDVIGDVYEIDTRGTRLAIRSFDRELRQFVIWLMDESNLEFMRVAYIGMSHRDDANRCRWFLP